MEQRTCWRMGNTAIDEMVKECEAGVLGWVMPGRLDRVEMKAMSRDFLSEWSGDVPWQPH